MRKNVYWIFHKGKYIDKPFMRIDDCVRYIMKNGLYDEYETNYNSDLEIVDRFGNSYNPDGTKYISPIEKDSRRRGLREGYLLQKMLKKDESLLESLISKYGKDEVMNEVNAKTYFDAGRKSFVKGQFNRANRFYDAATRKFRRDEETEEFDITDDGFEVWLPKEEKSIKLYYDLDEDQMYVDDYFHSERILREVGPFSQEIRTEDRKIIRMILNYFKEFNPDSQYNKKAMYIA